MSELFCPNLSKCSFSQQHAVLRNKAVVDNGDFQDNLQFSSSMTHVPCVHATSWSMRMDMPLPV